MNTRQVEIILALAENNMNVSDTARQLYMHRNTVVYHIQAVHKKTGFNPLKFYELCILITAARETLGEAQR